MDCAHGVPLQLKCGSCMEELMSTIDDTLAERGARYGSFTQHARISQAIQDVFRSEASGWMALADDQKQALTVIADKIARMLNGQPDYRDNWHDIVGYAKLVDDRLKLDQEPQLPFLPVSDGKRLDTFGQIVREKGRIEL